MKLIELLHTIEIDNEIEVVIINEVFDQNITIEGIPNPMLDALNKNILESEVQIISVLGCTMRIEVKTGSEAIE